MTREDYCTGHKGEKKAEQRQYNRFVRNQKHVKFYQSKEWKTVRVQALVRDHYLCVKCRGAGIYTKADVVDHIVELQDDFSLRSTLTNLMSLCHKHHNLKTAQEKKKRESIVQWGDNDDEK
ncbi:5-methylcytosine-specific restriction enzyme A [Mesobacillus persicus]|uniref:Putative HNH nuclease YajD n=1 Tax=Mesobacillus persicus TaxID=930146 RepID=A0A1H7XMX5_9BACI|nr:HNH endonuclease [Mesobacillus persicus]SEM35130.1 5-methylcytosine-specific restriction enzyme A [Mesobacillus persicus]